MRHILSLLVENEAGALSRVAGLFSARAFNIDEQLRSTCKEGADFMYTEDQYTPG